MNYQDPHLQSSLAAEYVLGTMPYLARLRFERLLAANASLQLAVSSWQNKLHPMYEQIAPREPSPRVWQAIQSRLNFTAPRISFWRRLGFWRNFAVVNLCITLAVSALLLNDTLEAPAYQAILHGRDDQVAMLAQFDRRLDTVYVQVLKPISMKSNQSLQLWLIKGDAQPVSLGLIRASGSESFHVDIPLDDSVTTTHLAVSLEPVGGSPTHLPSGEMILDGVLNTL
jgi:anti-sigma-K factor RskA